MGFSSRIQSLSSLLLLSMLLVGAAVRSESVQTTNESPATATNASAPPLATVTIQAHVPRRVGTVYITGNRAEIGLWNPWGLPMTGAGRDRTAVLHLPVGAELEYKFTLGSWDQEGVDPSGAILPNYRLLVTGDTNVAVSIPRFRKPGSDVVQFIDDWKGSGVLGTLVYWTNVPSRFLAVTRHVEIWLPPGYYDNLTNRYDVLYVHDGQNLFDPRIANTGIDWGVDEAIGRCMDAGKFPPPIVVGIWNTAQRLQEYSPWDLGTNYANFIIQELMPRVNRQFRTRTGPDHTAVMGSSMGGLISFWLCWQHPDVFGSAACLSTAFQWSGQVAEASVVGPPLIEGEIAKGTPVPHGIRLYFDYGLAGLDASCETEQNKVNAWLAAQGLREGIDFVVRRFPGADHNEASWRARMDEPLTFLYGNTNAKPASGT